MEATQRRNGNGTRFYDEVEILADAVVHCVGIFVAVLLGAVLLVYASILTAPEQAGPLALYVGTMLCVLTASLAFNQTPISPLKQTLARVDQAAIFIFIAGSYTPFLLMLDERSGARMLLMGVWGLSIVGAVLKLLVPDRFGRIAIVIYLALGWSGILVMGDISKAVTPMALVLLVLGGIVYSMGVIFHVWHALRHHNTYWHIAVVLGATLHMVAVLDCVVLSKL